MSPFPAHLEIGLQSSPALSEQRSTVQPNPVQRNPGQPFVVGIDLGTTYSAAAIVRGSVAEVCVLGTISAQIPTVVVHRGDGEILIGEAAERRAASEPTRTAREFKRRLGDPVPIIVGGTPYGAEALMAEMLEAIVRQVTEREGQPPSVVVLSHPANYTEYKRGLLVEAARLAGLNLDRVQLITEPEAAAIAYAKQERIDPGEVIAVYDFGGGTFDAAVVRSTAAGFELLGTPEGMERLGGIDFDQAVLSHVDTVLDGLISAADSSDTQVLAGQIRLRDECRRAKEALSNDTDATISVSIPGVQTDVRLTREEFEQMVRPRITETVKALLRTIASAGIGLDDVSRVLLVGGSSRMPIVAQVLRESIGRPVSVDADPKMTIAIGAAYSAMPVGDPQPHTTPPDVQPAAPPTRPTALPATPPRRRTTGKALVVGIAVFAAVAVAAGAAVFVTGNSDGSDAGRARATSVTPSGAAPAASPTTVDPSATLPTGNLGTGTQPSAGSVAGSEAGTSTPAPDGASPIERLAFNGRDDGTGIPGPALDASAPAVLTGLAVAPGGDVYVVSAAPSVIRIAGNQVEVAADFSAIAGSATAIAIGSDGTIFVATPAGIVRIVDGLSQLILDGPSSGLSTTLGPVALDGGGNLYVADNGTFRIIRRAPDGTLTLVAGTGTRALAAAIPIEGGDAASSAIGVVTGLTVRRDGTLLIADSDQQRVRAVAPDGTITTVAGGGTVDIGSLSDPTEAAGTKATDLRLGGLGSLAVDSGQTVYAADSAANVIVVVRPGGDVEVLIGDQSNAAAPLGLALSATGALLYSDGHVIWGVSD